MSYLPPSPDYSIQTAKHDFSSVNVLALNTPYTLVPAMGTGKVVVPVSGFINFTHVTTIYTNTTVYLGWGGANQSIYPAAFLNSASNTLRHITPISNSYPLNNSPFQIWAPVAPINGDGYFTIYLSYYILTL